jgi:uncharacterized protein (DUF1697 family)
VKYFAFLRGINVTGRNMLRMEDLRALCTSLGYGNVRTLLQSGNVIFETRRKPTAAQIAEAVRESSGLNIKVVLRTEAELRSVAERNPFVPVRDPSALLVFFLTGSRRGRSSTRGPSRFTSTAASSTSTSSKASAARS